MQIWIGKKKEVADFLIFAAASLTIFIYFYYWPKDINPKWEDGRMENKIKLKLNTKKYFWVVECKKLS
jgi:hypothetical protein